MNSNVSYMTLSSLSLTRQRTGICRDRCAIVGAVFSSLFVDRLVHFIYLLLAVPPIALHRIVVVQVFVDYRRESGLLVPGV